MTRKLELVAENGTLTIAGKEAVLRAERQLYADKGSLTYTGNNADLSRDYRVVAELGSYTIQGNPADLNYSRAILLQSGSYTVSGQAARLYESSFFYNDSEVIYVPQEINTVLVPPAVQDADETIVVPAEVQRLTLDFEDRQITVPADDPVEELAEYRESVAEARMRTA